MFSWLRSFARRGRRNSILQPAVEAVMETMEERRLLSCNYNISTGILTYTGTTGADTITIQTGSNSVTIHNTAESDCGISGGFPAQVVINGSDGNDSINASGLTTGIGVTILGGNGADTITGTDQNDSLGGDAGADSITGGA